MWLFCGRSRACLEGFGGARINPHVSHGFMACRCRTGGAGTAGAAGGAAAGVVAAPPPVPATFPEKLALAKALRDDHAARFSKLRTAPPATQYIIYVDRASISDFLVAEVVEETPVAEVLAA